MKILRADEENHIRKYYKCCGWEFFTDIIMITLLVMFAGAMSGLTLVFMSTSIVDLQVLAKSGNRKDRLYASKILPVVKRRHLVLCTLLISNCAAMVAIPVFLDNLVPDLGAILVSVTLILLFAEILPHSICAQHALMIGATLASVVRVLVWFFFPVAYPLSKFIDFLLGKGHTPLFRRNELKTLVDLHSSQAGKGGDLSQEETTIIAGALELIEKTAGDAMTPISQTFSIDINSKLDRELINLILEKGHSRVPVYYDQPSNIIGLILVKNLLTINPADELPVKKITIRRIPRISETMPLYDILNEFQKGLSHIAAVITQQNNKVEQPPSKHSPDDSIREVRVDIDIETQPRVTSLKSKRSLKKLRGLPGSARITHRETSKSRRWSDHFHPEVLYIDDDPLSTLTEKGEVIGIITMEDVIEELLKEKIFDERDHDDSIHSLIASNS